MRLLSLILTFRYMANVPTKGMYQFILLVIDYLNPHKLSSAGFLMCFQITNGTC